MATALRIGIVGIGRRGRHHADRLRRRQDCRLVAVSDPSVSRLPLAGQTYGCRSYDTLQSLLDDSEVEVVIFCSPPEARSDGVLSALQAGKHVLVEPPLSLCGAEARQMLTTSRRMGRTLGVVPFRHWDDHFRSALQCVQSGRLGELRALKLIVWQFSPLPALDDDGAKDERQPQRDPQGAILNRLAVQYFEQMLSLAQRSVRHVYATLGDRDTSALRADSLLAIVGFEGDLIAHVELSHASLAPLSTGWLIRGTQGAYREFQLFQEDEGEVISTALKRPMSDGDLFYENLYRHVREGASLEVPPEQSYEVVRLWEAVQQAAAVRQVVELPSI